MVFPAARRAIKSAAELDATASRHLQQYGALNCIAPLDESCRSSTLAPNTVGFTSTFRSLSSGREDEVRASFIQITSSDQSLRCERESLRSTNFEGDAKVSRNSARVSLLSLVVLLSLNSYTLADTASNRMSANVDRAYGVFKAEMIREGGATGDEQSDSSDFYENDNKSKRLRLSSCDNYDAIYPTEGPLRSTLMELAYRVTYAESVLQLQKYPKDAWVMPLRKYESGLIDKIRKGRRNNIGSEFMFPGSLSKEINARLAQMKSDKPKTIARGECGGGADPYRIFINPSEATVRVIPKIMYNYCKSVGINPVDFDHCDLWHAPILNGQEIYLAGLYMMVIKVGTTYSDVTEIDAARFDSDVHFEAKQ